MVGGCVKMLAAMAGRRLKISPPKKGKLYQNINDSKSHI